MQTSILANIQNKVLNQVKIFFRECTSTQEWEVDNTETEITIFCHTAY